MFLSTFKVLKIQNSNKFITREKKLGNKHWAYVVYHTPRDVIYHDVVTNADSEIWACLFTVMYGIILFNS